MNDWHQRKVAAIVGRHLGIQPEMVTSSMKLEGDFGLDPLDLVLISMRLENDAEEIATPFPVEALEGIETVGELTDVYRDWVRSSARDGKTFTADFYSEAWKRRRLRYG
jgi:acyl carrier protein